MIVYQSTAKDFISHADHNVLIDKIQEAYQEKLGRDIPPSELSAYQNSLPRMATVLRLSGVADDCGVLIEYAIPLTRKRIDFVVAGKNKVGERNFLIVELKQWQSAELVNTGYGLVETFVGGSNRTVLHPSEQSLEYSNFISDFNENVANGLVNIKSCAYLHNFKRRDNEPIISDYYKQLIEQSPVFFAEDQELLEKHIFETVGLGGGMSIIDDVDQSEHRPTKKLIDYISSIIDGKQEYVLLDEQKVAFEKVLDAVRKNERAVYIVKGGPGTGKSVVATALFARLIQEKKKTLFVAPNSSFRDTLVKKMAEDKQPTRLRNLFKGSAGFVDGPGEEYDALIVDESHRLKNGSAFMYKGENQVEDIIKAARTPVFFIDDKQIVRPSDIGSVSEVRRIAEESNLPVYEMQLQAQFRCSGVDGYINWLDDVLQIQETANYDGWSDGNFDFQIFSNPNKLRELIKQRNNEGFSARILAGYAWQWTSEKNGNYDGDIEDVAIPEFDFSMPWNSRKVGTTWAIDQSGINQVGCIHTSQGLEFDYVGVIVGGDLEFNPETLSYYSDHEKYKDSEGKKGLRDDPTKLNELIRNIYKVLMTRGMRGCYVYFVDKNVEEHFKERLNKQT